MKQTHFGFQTIDSDQKTGRVQRLFEQVSGRYDLMNDLMSLGIHRCWKAHMVKNLPLKAHDVVLDVAGGTGDIAFRLCDAYPHLNLNVMVCDLTPGMLSVGRDRAFNTGIIDEIQWICGNGEALPIPDNSVDLYTIAFGLRNITHIDQALAEAYRVLKPGGTFACLEFSEVSIPLLNRIYEFYSFSFIPWLGERIASDRDSYQYLVESIRRFPPQEQLSNMMKNTGFNQISWQNYFAGVSCLHQATKKG